MLPVGSGGCEAGGEVVQSLAPPAQITPHSVVEAMRETDQPIIRRGRRRRGLCGDGHVTSDLARGERPQPRAQPGFGIRDRVEVERRPPRLLPGALGPVAHEGRGV